LKKPATELFSIDAMEFMRSEISANEGDEICFVGNIDRYGIVNEIETVAYGNSESSAVVMIDALQGDVLIHNHPSGELQASAQDINLSSLLANKGIGFYIIDNECEFANIIVKPKARIYIQENEVLDIFHSRGILCENISNFESRAEQIEMVEKVCEAVNYSRILICEAGTGTGKSLSYLIPASIWAVENKKRVLVSTHTINLQQQIFNKDMEIVSRVIRNYLEKDVNYSVLVGKGNYLCKKKLYDILRDRDKQASLFDEGEEMEVLFAIEQWVRNAVEGTRAEFGEPVGSDIWEEIACDSMTCSRKKCNYYSECFYYSARLQAEKSNIIIANHSLVFSTIDEMSHRSALPYFAGIVFDEAHHIEDVALKSMSKDFSILGIMFHLRKLYSPKKDKDRDNERGLLVLLNRKGAFDGYPELREAFMALLDRIRQLASICGNVNRTIRETLTRNLPFDSGTIGIDEKFINSRFYKGVLTELSEIFNRVKDYTVQFEILAERISDLVGDEAKDIIRSITVRNGYLLEMASTFELIFDTEHQPEFVKWIEISKKNIRFSYSPLEVGDFIANSIFSKKEFTVLTSATLMINKKFDYLKNSTGLNIATDKEKIEFMVLSPFDYTKQAEIFIMKDDVSHSDLSKEKTRIVRELALISGGGTLVLFTSYSRLGEMYDILRDELMDNGLLPIRQGEKTRAELLEIMKSRSYVVLFATSSFWEGIDVPGENLRCVIIEKLPFDNPSDPIYNAKAKLLEMKNINPFTYYSIPRAVLKLKQGLGRLIRSKTDKGIIAILDNRIKTKNYGSVFINSLPPTNVVYGDTKHIICEAERFFINNMGHITSGRKKSSKTDTKQSDSYKKWNVEEDEQLRVAVSDGISEDEIAVMLGRPKVTVTARIRKLGLH